MYSEKGDVLLTLAQRRNADGDNIKPVIEIFAESPLFKCRAQIDVGRGNHAHIDIASHV